MRRFAKSINVSSLVLVAVLLAVVVYEEVGARPPMLMKPTTVATVRLSKVLEGLEQRAEAEVALTAMAETVKAEAERREAEIRNLQTQTEGADTAEQRMRLDEQLALTSLNYQAWLRFKQEQVDVERALLLEALYRSIRKAIAEMAETEGYDLVAVDDSEGAVTWSDDARVPREAQVLQQIAGRRLLYTNPSVDITDDVVARMNNAFRTGTQ
ncbi:MAG: OmpH/Skp family outer membrane protein [Planctomycetota bacterium]|jgi:Skp family chaperone for outer membrane proteins